MFRWKRQLSQIRLRLMIVYIAQCKETNLPLCLAYQPKRNIPRALIILYMNKPVFDWYRYIELFTHIYIFYIIFFICFKFFSDFFLNYIIFTNKVVYNKGEIKWRLLSCFYIFYYIEGVFRKPSVVNSNLFFTSWIHYVKKI